MIIESRGAVGTDVFQFFTCGSESDSSRSQGFSLYDWRNRAKSNHVTRNLQTTYYEDLTAAIGSMIGSRTTYPASSRITVFQDMIESQEWMVFH